MFTNLSYHLKKFMCINRNQENTSMTLEMDLNIFLTKAGDHDDRHDDTLVQ